VPIAQVPQTVEPDARREAAVELGFGGRVGRRRAGLGNTAGERAVVERGESGILGHAPSITFLSEDV
jgi:hypothetical protein